MMPIISLDTQNPFKDGRQSERALKIRTGIERYYAQRNWVTLSELTLKNGRRADLIALGPKGEVDIIEIKSSILDFQCDQKWPDYLDHCDRFYFATLADVPSDIFPEEEGLIISDGYEAEILRHAEERRIPAARRKTLHLLIARLASQRLERCAQFAGISAGSDLDK